MLQIKKRILIRIELKKPFYYLNALPIVYLKLLIFMFDLIFINLIKKVQLILGFKSDLLLK